MDNPDRNMDQNKKSDGSNAFKGLQDLLKVEEAIINALNKFIGIPEGIRNQMPEVAEMLGSLVDKLGDVTQSKVNAAMGLGADLTAPTDLEPVEPPIEQVGGEGYEIGAEEDLGVEERPVGGIEGEDVPIDTDELEEVQF